MALAMRLAMVRAINDASVESVVVSFQGLEVGSDVCRCRMPGGSVFFIYVKRIVKERELI